MPRAHPTQPLVVVCELCAAANSGGENPLGRIPTFRAVAWYAAIDHALDYHRDKLLASPKEARRFFRVTNPATGRPSRLPATK